MGNFYLSFNFFFFVKYDRRFIPYDIEPNWSVRAVALPGGRGRILLPLRRQNPRGSKMNIFSEMHSSLTFLPPHPGSYFTVSPGE